MAFQEFDVEQNVVTYVGKMFKHKKEAKEFLIQGLSLCEGDKEELVEWGIDKWLEHYGYEWDIAGASTKGGYVIGVPVSSLPESEAYPSDCYYAEEHWMYVFPNEKEAVAYVV